MTGSHSRPQPMGIAGLLDGLAQKYFWATPSNRAMISEACGRESDPMTSLRGGLTRMSQPAGRRGRGSEDN